MAKPAPPLSFDTGSKNRSSLDYPKKKVGHYPPQYPNFPAERCDSPHGMHFICGNGHNVYRTLPCHARFVVDCPYCAEKWRKKVMGNFKKRVKRMKYPAFVTFTLKKGGAHALYNLNGLIHRCRRYVRRKKKPCKKHGKTDCEVCSNKPCKAHGKKRCKKCGKSYEIRGWVACLDPPNHVHAIWDCDYIPQKQLSKLWKLVSGDSFVVDIRKVEKQRWKEYFSKICYYISKISRSGCSVGLSGMSGVHVVNSWGNGGYYKKLRMVCKICGSYFMPLWYAGQVCDFDNDPVDFVEVDNDYG